MSELRDFKFNKIYPFVEIIERSVHLEIELDNFDEDYFIQSTTKFRKDTVLHQYIACGLSNYYSRYFRKNGDLFEEDRMQYWQELFSQYSIEIENIDYENEDLDLSEETYAWYMRNEDKFDQLFAELAEEVFHILFANRGFLLKFNTLITNTVKEIQYPTKFLTAKKTLKRANIPKWVKNAVFHRDKGRCVFCNTDLTSMVNTLVNSNYDHIVPLDKFGINDPGNIQLCCEKCNKSKTNKEGSTSNNYFSWWKRD